MWYVSWIIMFLLHQKHEVLQKKGKNTFIPGGGCWFLSQRKMEDLRPMFCHFEGKNECCGAWDLIEYFIFSALVHGPASYHQMC
jgi:hypothetical protein